MVFYIYAEPCVLYLGMAAIILLNYPSKLEHILLTASHEVNLKHFKKWKVLSGCCYTSAEITLN